MSVSAVDCWAYRGSSVESRRFRLSYSSRIFANSEQAARQIYIYIHISILLTLFISLSLFLSLSPFLVGWLKIPLNMFEALYTRDIAISIQINPKLLVCMIQRVTQKPKTEANYRTCRWPTNTRARQMIIYSLSQKQLGKTRAVLNYFEKSGFSSRINERPKKWRILMKFREFSSN